MSDYAHDLDRRCSYEHRCIPKRHGGVDYSYVVRGPMAAVHLHVYDSGERLAKHGHRFSGGVEIHYRNPPESMRNEAPSHEECWVLGCPCWHDGSSTWANEVFVPMFEQDAGRPPDPLLVLRRLRVEAGQYLFPRDGGEL